MISIARQTLKQAPLELATSLHDAAVACYAEGDAVQAELLFRRELRLLEQAAGKNSPAVANALNHLATIHEDRCEYAKAERFARRAVKIMARVEGGAEIARLRVQALTRLGRIHCAQWRYDQAEPLLQRALALAEQNFGSDALAVSAALNELAALYKHTGRCAEAGSLYQRSLAITEAALGPESLAVAAIYHNLGGLEHAAGNFARGEPFARRAVKIREKLLGPDHVEVAAGLAALAALLDGQQKYAEAERLYRRALAIFARQYGEEHYEIAVNLNNLAALYHAQHRIEEAEELYRRALAIKEKLLGGEHPDTGFTLNNLAVFYKAQKRYSEAEPLYQRTIAIFEQALGPQHPNVAICLDNYAELLRKTKRTDEARALESRARAIRQGLETLTEDGLMATGTINPQYACFALAVRPSRVHRRGVFAGERIPARRKVIEYTGERIGRREAKRRSGRSLHYLFRLDSYRIVDGAVGGSGAEYINHSCDPNTAARKIKGHILYFSKRQIEPGEELTIDYRFSPKADKTLCRCGSPKCRGTINRIQ